MMQFQQVRQTNYTPFEKSRCIEILNQERILNSDLSNVSNHTFITQNRPPSEEVSSYIVKNLTMVQVFECLYFNDGNKLLQKFAVDRSAYIGSIKMMDTILFENYFKPIKWIYTDVDGPIQSRKIKDITINDVIRAFLVNLNEKKNKFNNEDLMDFLTKETNRQKICFVLIGNKREFLNIEQLCDIKNNYPSGIDALQLFKIPTREFFPFFYYHNVVFKKKGDIQTHSMTKMSHFVKDLQFTIKNSGNLFEELIPPEELESYAEEMFEVSKQIIERIEVGDPLRFVKKIKIAYLIESNTYDPWFIGTDYCIVHTPRDRTSRSMAGPRKKKMTLFSKNLQAGSNSKRETTYADSEGLYKGNTTVSQINQPSGRTSSQIVFQEDNIRDSTSMGKVSAYNPQEDYYQLSSKEIVSQQDLLNGLLQIGMSFGKDTQKVVQRPKTIQLNQQKRDRKLIQYEQDKFNERNRIKEKGRRILQLFPKYLEKCGSKAHSKFFFGSHSSERVFQNYQRLRFSKDIHGKVEIGIDETKKKKSPNRLGQIDENRSIFDVQMSEQQNQSNKNLNQSFVSAYKDKSEQKYQQELVQNIDSSAILQNDISMFYGNDYNPSRQDASNIMGSYTQPEESSFGERLLEYNNKVFRKINKSMVRPETRTSCLIEPSIQSQKQNIDIDDDIMQIMRLNQSLENIVVVDRDKTISEFKQRVQMKEKQQIQKKPEQEKIFTNERRKLNADEASKYYEWKRSFLSKMQTQNEFAQNLVKPINILTDPSNKESRFPKRSHTSVGRRKIKEQGKAFSALSQLRVEGVDAQKVYQSGFLTQKQQQRQFIIRTKEKIQQSIRSREDKVRECKFKQFCQYQMNQTLKRVTHANLEMLLQAEKLIELNGKDFYMKQFKLANQQNKEETYTAIHPKNLNIESLDSMNSKRDSKREKIDSRKDMSIDAQQSLRKNLEHPQSNEAENSMECELKMPEIEKKISQAIPLCQNCSTIISFILQK